MYQPIMIFLKSGEIGFCTLKYSDVTDLKSQVDSISMSDDVDRVELESHLLCVDMEKLRRDVAQWCETSNWQHDNPCPRSDKTFNEQIKEEFDENPYRDSKCDNCNCALRDCSLCGSGDEG